MIPVSSPRYAQSPNAINTPAETVTPPTRMKPLIPPKNQQVMFRSPSEERMAIKTKGEPLKFAERGSTERPPEEAANLGRGKDVPAGTADASVRLRKAQEAYDKASNPVPKSQADKFVKSAALRELNKAQAEVSRLQSLKPFAGIDTGGAGETGGLGAPPKLIPERTQVGPSADLVQGGAASAAKNRANLSQIRIQEAEADLAKAKPNSPAWRTAKRALAEARSKVPTIGGIAKNYMKQIEQGGNPATPDLIPSR